MSAHLTKFKKSHATHCSVSRCFQRTDRLFSVYVTGRIIAILLSYISGKRFRFPGCFNRLEVYVHFLYTTTHWLRQQNESATFQFCTMSDTGLLQGLEMHREASMYPMVELQQAYDEVERLVINIRDTISLARIRCLSCTSLNAEVSQSGTTSKLGLTAECEATAGLPHTTLDKSSRSLTCVSRNNAHCPKQAERNSPGGDWLLGTENVSVSSAALGRLLAVDILAPLPVPRVATSIVDGYAFKNEVLKKYRSNSRSVY
eukprot:GHVT01003178.1.p1 GENE.GHVT01003178.1~~GHVT01003178.1.p1  ORF type:complete len:259 (-),score=-8.99 GHVT01003178.1:707-1483(-)